MTTGGIPDERMKELLARAGVPAAGSGVTRRRWPRFAAEGEVRFTRPMEKAQHAGELADISRGGLAFLTTVSLAVGETLRLSWEEDGKPRSAEGAVESLHAHPKDKRALVGVKFAR